VTGSEDEISTGAERAGTGSIEAYGVDWPDGGRPRVVARIAGQIVNLDRLQKSGALQVSATLDNSADLNDVFAEPSLNRFMALGPTVWHAVEEELAKMCQHPLPQDALIPPTSVRLVMPIEVADFCDFYASEFHASNMGRILRPDSDLLPAAWRHIPLGYHGRAGTVRVSGTPVRRPVGVVATADGPKRRPCARLDLEVEIGYIIGTPSNPGEPVRVDAARDHIFGLVIVNDWSARDIQAFEYQPLGPFLGKSFATSISPWVVPLSAVERYLVDGPEQGPEVDEQLASAQPRALDLHMELTINSTVVSQPEGRYVHWSIEQMITHLTSNGATLRTGDLIATGTVSGPDPGTWGSMMEIAWAGERPVHLDDGSARGWLEDGDEVTIRATCGCGGSSTLDFGEVTGVILKAIHSEKSTV